MVNVQWSIKKKVNVERINQIIAAKPNLSTALGMEFISTPEDDTCMARMKVFHSRGRYLYGPHEG